MVTTQAKPFEMRWDPQTTACISIDFQRDFMEAGGFGETLGNDVSTLREAIEPTKELFGALRKAGVLMIHTREGHRPDLGDLHPAKRDRGNPSLRIGDQGPMGRILVRGEYGHDIIDELKALEGEIVLDKPGKDSFYGTDLDVILKAHNIKTLIIVGVTTEVCVQSTARAANDRGYECMIVEDCTASYFPEFKQAALEMFAAQGAIVGWVANSKDVIASL